MVRRRRPEVAGEVGRHPRGHPGAVVDVLAGEHLTGLVDAADQVAAVVRHEHLDVDVGLGQLVGDEGAQLVEALAGAGRHDDRVLLVPTQPVDDLRVGEVGLVDDDDLAHVGGVDVGEHGAHRGDLALGVGVRAVDDVQQQVGLGDLLERGAERLDELVRQRAHEADGVDERVEATVGRLGPAHGGVEGREQLVLDEHPGTGEPVEDRGLAGVGVPGDGDARHGIRPAAAALGVADRLHLLDLTAQLGDAGVDPATVELDLGLTRSARAHALAAGGLATGLARHRLTPATQARQEVLQLGQLDLRLALPALRVLGEDVEDQRGAVDDLDLDDVLEGAALARRELGVADDGVGALGDDDVAQLDGLALAEVGGGVGVRPALDDTGEHLGPGGLGERGELAHRVLGVVGGALAPDGGEHDPLEPQLAVLDLGDVLELGGQPGDAAQRGALLAVELVAVEGDVVVQHEAGSLNVAVSKVVSSAASASARPERMFLAVMFSLGSHRATPGGEPFLPGAASVSLR